MKYIFSLSSLLIFTVSFSQKDTMKSIYKNLPILKLYTITTETVTEKGTVVYKAGGKAVDKATYEKYATSAKNMTQCKPCIMETYDKNNKLASRAIKYLDCPVGYWLNYYPSGKIKSIGHYRENESDIWDPLWDAGYCMKHGWWTDYNEKGKVIKKERYEFGSLKD